MMGGGGRKDFATELLDKMRHNINAEEVKEMEADGGIDLNELETILAKGGLKPSTKIIEKFQELDTNKNGKIEESEVESEGSGEDYFFWFGLFYMVTRVVVGIAGVAALSVAAGSI